MGQEMREEMGISGFPRWFPRMTFVGINSPPTHHATLIMFTPLCLATCTFADSINTTLYLSIHARSPCSSAFGRPAQDHLCSLDGSCKVRRGNHPRLGAR